VIEGAFFVLAMLFFADSGRHVRCFGFYWVQPLRHSSQILRGCRQEKLVVRTSWPS